MKYSDWLQEWLKNCVAPSCKTRTTEKYAQICRLHIEPMLGEYDMEDLTAFRLQGFVTELIKMRKSDNGQTYSPNFVNLIISVLKASIHSAFEYDITSVNESVKIHRPRVIQKNIECFTIAEQHKIEHAVLAHKHHKMLGILLCLYTGLRIGKLLSLTWDDIDFESGILKVNKSCHDGTIDGRHCRIIDTPKTPAANRFIPLPKQLLPIIKEWHKCSNSNFIVCDCNDKPCLVRSYQNSFAILLRSLNIPHKGFHTLRHTFATRALECGIDVKTLAEILGHKNATITLNRYAHSLMEHKRAMMCRIGNLLKSI